MSAVVHRSRHDRNFVIVPNAIAQAPALSYRARGLLVAILSRPPGASLSLEVLAAEAPHGEGREAVASAMRELKDAGYVRQVRRRNEQGHIVTDTLVTDVPQGADEGTVDGAAPQTGSRGPVNRGAVDQGPGSRAAGDRGSVSQGAGNQDPGDGVPVSQGPVPRSPGSRAAGDQGAGDPSPVTRQTAAPTVRKGTSSRNAKSPTPSPSPTAAAPRSRAKRGRGDQLTPEPTPTTAPVIATGSLAPAPQPLEPQQAPALTAPPAPDPTVIARFIAGLPERMRPIKPGDTAKVAYALAGFLAAGWDPDTLAALVSEAAPPTRIVSRSGLITSRLEALAGAEAAPLPGQRMLPFEQVPWCGQCDSPGYRWVIDEATDTARYCPTCSPQATARSHAG